MVTQIIRHIYLCEECGKEFDRYHEAKACESSHGNKETNSNEVNKP